MKYAAFHKFNYYSILIIIVMLRERVGLGRIKTHSSVSVAKKTT